MDKSVLELSKPIMKLNHAPIINIALHNVCVMLYCELNNINDGLMSRVAESYHAMDCRDLDLYGHRL